VLQEDGAVAVRLLDARNKIITLLKNVAPFGGVGAKLPYSETRLRNAYPREDAEAPTLALSKTGGPLPGPVGMGTARRRHHHSLQMDVLGRDPVEAARIWELASEAIRNDFDYYEPDPLEAGKYGKGFLRHEGLRSVIVGEPAERAWDEKNPDIARLSGEVVIEFDDD
jgi:hypothetical protein